MFDRDFTRSPQNHPTTPVLTAPAIAPQPASMPRAIGRLPQAQSPSRPLPRLGHFLSQAALLGSLVGLGTVLSLGVQGLRPPAAIAYEARATVTIDHEPGESYNTLLRRAEAVGRAAAQRSFDNDILVSEVLIFVNAQKQGMEAPLLAIQASRFQWNSLPDARRWSIYYTNTRELLGLEYGNPDAGAAGASSTAAGLGAASVARDASTAPAAASAPATVTPFFPSSTSARTAPSPSPSSAQGAPGTLPSIAVPSATPNAINPIFLPGSAAADAAAEAATALTAGTAAGSAPEPTTPAFRALDTEGMAEGIPLEVVTVETGTLETNNAESDAALPPTSDLENPFQSLQDQESLTP